MTDSEIVLEDIMQTLTTMGKLWPYGEPELLHTAALIQVAQELMRIRVLLEDAAGEYPHGS